MQEEVILETLVELGDRKFASGETDRAIHYYNQALKKEPEAALVNFKLADAYGLKSETGGKVFCVLAAEAVRRVFRNDPFNEAAHGKLMALAIKGGTLDALAREYAERAKADTPDGFYASQLRRVYLLALMDRELKPLIPEYNPVIYIKYFFDLVILPAGVTGILMNNLGPKFKPFFALGMAFFLFYCAYRYVLYLLLRKK